MKIHNSMIYLCGRNGGIMNTKYLDTLEYNEIIQKTSIKVNVKGEGEKTKTPQTPKNLWCDD